MSKFRRYAFPLVIALQVLAVLGFAGVREATLRTGTEVILQTVPVDPRDLFRGDYVALRYTISTLSNCYIQEPGETIYLHLERKGDVWEAGDYGYSAPNDGRLYIRGTVTRALPGNQCQVEYGIESYFVPEGSGLKIERSRVPVRVKAAVDAFGTAAIKEVITDTPDRLPTAAPPDAALGWAELKIRGEQRWRQGDFQGAIDDLTLGSTRAVAQSDRSLLIATRIQVRVSAGDLNGALADADEGMKANAPAVIRESRGYVLLEMGRYDEALAEYQRVLRELRPGTPSWSTVFVGRAIALNGTGEKAAALRDLEAGLPQLPAGTDTSPYARELAALGKAASR